jgi:RNA polymerase sigma-70 factor (ECF subfamily)
MLPTMDPTPIRAQIAEGEVEAATEQVLRDLGPAIYSLLVGLHSDPVVADEIFAEFAERLWRSLPRYRGECSVRSWAYRIARAASVDHRRRAGRAPALTSPSHLRDVARQVRTQTASYLGTERRSALQELRRELSEEEQLILVLRVDRDLSWTEVAQVFMEERDLADADDLARVSARLRQRFKTSKRRLKQLASQRGLLPS